MDLFFLVVTWFGSLYLLLPISLVMAAQLLLRHRNSDALFLLGGVGGASLLVYGMKRLIARPRPPAVQDLLVSMPADFSFPSAHTAQITAFACACALLLGKNRPVRQNLPLWLGGGTLALLVGISRHYLRVHYISDVVAGALVGAVWVFLLRRLLTLFGGRG